MDSEHAASLGRRYLIRFEEDTLRQRPLRIRLIIEFLGTFVLVTAAAGSGVINHYVGDSPISRAAAVIAPGAVVMAMIYAWGPLSGLHINPAVTFGFTARGVFPRKWVVPYWAVQFAGAICAALFLQGMFGDVSAGGNYPIAKHGGDWRSLVMEIVLTAILVSVILNTATGGRSIGHNAAIAVGSTAAHEGSFLIALPYGERTDWLKNVLVKGSATLTTGGKTYQVDRPEVIPMTEATIYFRPGEQRLHRQFHVSSALRLRRE
jgi:aquaporin Z